MKQVFKRKLKKAVWLCVLLFVVLFVFRLLYGYTKKTNARSTTYRSQFFENTTNIKKNYASKSYKVKTTQTQQASAQVVDQKYEKIAQISSQSNEFDNDETKVRAEINRFDALIQFEQKSGNIGQRRLHLAIGVPPNHFDSLYANLIKIGRIQAKQITKKDKTNEYNELNAKKQSLEKTRNALRDLTSKAGKIEEFMNLENRILEIEQQLQNLGVSLGNFDDANEFCTIQFSLSEGKVIKISFLHRVKVALEWTVSTYLKIGIGLFFMSLFCYLLLICIDKLKLIEGNKS